MYQNVHGMCVNSSNSGNTHTQKPHSISINFLLLKYKKAILEK